LPGNTTQAVVRAFSYFLQLANIAEDEHHIRRRRAHDLAGSPPREGSLVFALDSLSTAAVSPEAIADFFAHAVVAPVLTAHPTEVQRQSLIRNHRDLARLLDQRERLQMTPEEVADNDLALANSILTLWQSRMLRPVRLKVLDEVKNGITYFKETFFTELPRLYIQATQQLQKRYPEKTWALPPFFRVGSWIGGDRDGNPFVTAEILREALRLQSAALSITSMKSTNWVANSRCPTAGHGHAGTAGPGRTLDRPLPATCRRALPPCPVRHLRTPRCHLACSGSG
jgi:phosphoenolpyruvate carboxylase